MHQAVRIVGRALSEVLPDLYGAIVMRVDPDPETGSPKLVQRDVVAAMIVVALLGGILVSDYFLGVSHPLTVPAPNALRNTLHGPVLLFAMPLTIAWFFSVVRTRGLRVAGYVLAALMMAACVLLTWGFHQVAHAAP